MSFEEVFNLFACIVRRSSDMVRTVNRAVTRVAVKETRAAEVKAEILNSERLQAHFEENPADLQLLQHDRQATHVSKVQSHLKNVPGYLLPRGMQVANVSRKRRKKKTRSQQRAAAGRQRNKSNDPLQTFDGDVAVDGLIDVEDEEGGDSGGLDEDRFFDDEDGEGDEMTKEEKNAAYLDPCAPRLPYALVESERRQLRLGLERPEHLLRSTSNKSPD